MVLFKKSHKKKDLGHKKSVKKYQCNTVARKVGGNDEEKMKSEEQYTGTLGKDDLMKEMMDQGRVALTALKRHIANSSGKSLFPEIDQAVGLLIVYKVPPLTTNRAHVKIELPCSPRTVADTSVCLIMPDLDQSAAARKDPDVDKQARQWAEKIEKDHGLLSQHYSRILTKRQLEREYHTFVQRRALASSYDLFLVDVRVGKAVRTFLGKDFYKVHKEPLDFDYSKPLVNSIKKAANTVVMKLPRYATRAHIPFGHLGQDSADLASNFDEVINAVVSKCPGGLPNIRSIYMQSFKGSLSLPVYVDEGSASQIRLEQPQKRRKAVEQVFDECSTLPDGLKLAVRRNGKVRVISEDSSVAVHYPTVDDEWEERDSLKPTIDLTKLKRKHNIKKKRQQRILAQRRIKSGERLSLKPGSQVKPE